MVRGRTRSTTCARSIRASPSSMSRAPVVYHQIPAERLTTHTIAAGSTAPAITTPTSYPGRRAICSPSRPLALPENFPSRRSVAARQVSGVPWWQRFHLGASPPAPREPRWTAVGSGPAGGGHISAAGHGCHDGDTGCDRHRPHPFGRRHLRLGSPRRRAAHDRAGLPRRGAWKSFNGILQGPVRPSPRALSPSVASPGAPDSPRRTGSGPAARRPDIPRFQRLVDAHLGPLPAGSDARTRWNIGRGRLVVATGVIVVVVGMQLRDIATQTEHWPFSPYRMYSREQSRTQAWTRVYGVTSHGEIYLMPDRYLSPFDLPAYRPSSTATDPIDRTGVPPRSKRCAICTTSTSSAGRPARTTGRRSAPSDSIGWNGRSMPRWRTRTFPTSASSL